MSSDPYPLRTTVVLDEGCIIQEVLTDRSPVQRSVICVREEQTIEALKQLGWTPPPPADLVPNRQTLGQLVAEEMHRQGYGYHESHADTIVQVIMRRINLNSVRAACGKANG